MTPDNVRGNPFSRAQGCARKAAEGGAEPGRAEGRGVTVLQALVAFNEINSESYPQLRKLSTALGLVFSVKDSVNSVTEFSMLKKYVKNQLVILLIKSLLAPEITLIRPLK